MAITLDTIVTKEFTVVKNGYDNGEVEAFLDEILEEMENREAATARLQEQVEELTRDLEQARAELVARPVIETPVETAAPVAPAAPVSTVSDRHSTESFELVLSKAKAAYEEIVATAELRAEEIIAKANEEADALRTDAETQISDLTGNLASLRSQTAEYYASLKKIVDDQAATMEQIKKLL